MSDRIVSEAFLDEIITALVTATHPRPYLEVTKLLEKIHRLPKKEDDDLGTVSPVQ